MNIQVNLEETGEHLAKDVWGLGVYEQLSWLATSGTLLRQWGEIENVSSMVQAKILYTTFTKWELLSHQAKSQWEGDFYKWAKAFTATAGSPSEPAENTINNKITVYRDWTAEPMIEYPDTVVIPERNSQGEVTGEKKIPFDPGSVGYGKLLIARGTARRGEMTPEAWSVLADPHGTVSQLKQELRLSRSKPPEDNFEVYEHDGMIYAKQNGESIPIFQICFESEYAQPNLFKRGVAYFFKVLGMPASRFEL